MRNLISFCRPRVFPPIRSTHRATTGLWMTISMVAIVAFLVAPQPAFAVAADDPPAADDPILGLPNALLVPHIGSATEETRYAMRELAVRNLLAVLNGEEPPTCLNPEVLE